MNAWFDRSVEPDPQDDPWPSRRFLRQGVRANGWVLLNVVPLGFELWRQFNGFPPVIAPDEPAAAMFDPAGREGGAGAANSDGAKGGDK